MQTHLLLQLSGTMRSIHDEMVQVRMHTAEALAVQQELIALARRHPRAAEAFVMFIRGVSVAKIALKWGVSIATVYRWIHMASELLQRHRW